MRKEQVIKQLSTYCLILATFWLLDSCAVGYESPDGFDVGVNNEQLKSPPADSILFSVNSNEKEAVISWPLVLGAKGYEVSFENIDNPDSIYSIDGYLNKLVDGSHFSVSVAPDSRYRLTIRTLGDPRRGNTDDPDSTVVKLSTLVPAVAVIPDSSDIYVYMQNFLANDTVFGKTSNEVAIELLPEGKYTISGPVDFGGQKLTFRGDKIKRSQVKVIGTGGFQTYSGLKLKFIDFDLSESTGISLISMSALNLPDRIKSQNLGYIRNGALINNIYIVLDPIYIADCWFKDMPNSMLYDNGIDCAYWDFKIDNCVVQLKNKGTYPFVNLQTKGRAIKNILIKNSTLYNTLDCGAYFMRYSNSSNSNPEKIFGNVSSAFSSTSINFTRSTFSKTYNKGQFSNNFNGTGLTVNVDHCIFYDCYQVARRTFDLSGAVKSYQMNFWYAVTNPDVSEAARKDTGGQPFATVANPLFVGDVTQSLDFTLPYCGVNFKPGEFEVLVKSSGDPRWLVR